MSELVPQASEDPVTGRLPSARRASTLSTSPDEAVTALKHNLSL